MGVRVSCLCPMGVRTPLLERGLAGGEASVGLRLTNSAAPLLAPDVVASAVVEGVGSGHFLIYLQWRVMSCSWATAVFGPLTSA